MYVLFASVGIYQHAVVSLADVLLIDLSTGEGMQVRDRGRGGIIQMRFLYVLIRSVFMVVYIIFIYYISYQSRVARPIVAMVINDTSSVHFSEFAIFLYTRGLSCIRFMKL